MRLPEFRYVAPSTLDEATAVLEEYGSECRIIAGGTDLLPSMKQRIFKPKVLLSLEHIRSLDRMEFDSQGDLRIGPLVRVGALEKEVRILRDYPMVAQAAKAVASPQLRQMGTLGGNLSLDTRCYYYNQSESWRRSRPKCIKMGGDRCNAVGGGKKCFAVFSGDLGPALMALDAKITLVSRAGERTIPLSGYYTGKGESPFATDSKEFILGVQVSPPPQGAVSAYYKYRIRKSIDFPLASVAAVIKTDKKEKKCLGASVIISAVGARPQEVEDIGRLLEGERLDRVTIEKASELAFKAARPVANQAGSPEHRRLMIKSLVKKALEEAAQP
jgi:4-hydroxybenzoyl-CoA reductase subunit beta